MEVKEITADQLLGELRAAGQRMETKYHALHRQLAAVLWCNGPMHIDANVPGDLVIEIKKTKRGTRLSAVMPAKKAAGGF